MVVVPMRKPEDSAASRSFQSSLLGRAAPGGLTHAHDNSTSQMIYNNYMLANMLWMLSSTAIPVVLLSFPEHALDSNYSYAKLRPLLALYRVSRERFAAEHTKLSHPEFVKSFSPIEEKARHS